MKFTIDIEPTNRCNAKCGFCPRDMTPHQGLMTPEVFTQALARASEFRDLATETFDAEVSVSLCGLGEPLLNRNTASFVRQVREAGLKCVMSSNAALLDEQVGRELLDAGLQMIYINAGDRDKEYEDVYKLPFEQTRANIARFREMASDRCDVFVIIVNHHNDLRHVSQMKEYWRNLGIERFQRHDIMNRGGSLYIERMQFATHPHRDKARELFDARGVNPICGVAFMNLFIGYDGQYYLCCSDWEKRVPLGSVFDESFLSITAQKLHHVSTREPICSTCCHDPVNRVAEQLEDVASGAEEEESVDQVVAKFADGDAGLRATVDRLLGVAAESAPPAVRRAIPVNAD